MNERNHRAIIAWALLILLASIWGSSFILMKKAMFGDGHEMLLSNNQVAALRILIASIAMLPFILRRLRSTMRRHAIPLILAGWLGNGLPAFLFTAAQTELDSSITGILNSLTPLFTLLVALALYRKRYPVLNYVGIFTALIGAIFLIFEHSNGLAGAPLWAYGCVTAATVCYAISVNVIRNNLTKLNAIEITGMAMLWVSPWCLGYLWYDGFFGEVLNSPTLQKGLPYVFVLAIVGTAGALVLFNQLIKMSNALFASSVTYLIPVVALSWGFLDSEHISLLDLTFTGVIISGVYMVNLKPKKTKGINI